VIPHFAAYINYLRLIHEKYYYKIVMSNIPSNNLARSQDSNMTYILIADDGQEYGPYTIDQLGTLVEESRLHSMSYLRDEDGLAVTAHSLLGYWAESINARQLVSKSESSHVSSHDFDLEQSVASEEDLRALLHCRRLLGWTLGVWMCGWALILYVVVSRDVRIPSHLSEVEWIGRSFHLISALLYENCNKSLPYNARIKGVGKQPDKSLGILFFIFGPFSPILIRDLYKRLNCFMKVLVFPEITSRRVVEHIENRIALIKSRVHE